MYGSTRYYAVLFDKMALHTLLDSYDLRLIISFVDEFHTNLFYIVYHFNITALELSLSNSVISVSKVSDQMQYNQIDTIYMRIYSYLQYL